MKDEKRFEIYIKESSSGFFTINGRKVRTPVRFIATESELSIIKTKIKLEAITEFDISLIKNNNERVTAVVK
jgi:hypothetical protein